MTDTIFISSLYIKKTNVLPSSDLAFSLYPRNSSKVCIQSESFSLSCKIVTNINDEEQVIAAKDIFRTEASSIDYFDRLSVQNYNYIASRSTWLRNTSL